MPDFSFEKIYWHKKKIVAGCDEAGRGPLAGPVFAASIVFHQNATIPDNLNDSKKLSHKEREKIFEEITESEIDYNITAKDNNFIDKYNILQASIIAINEASDGLKIKPNHLLVDGNKFHSKFSFTTIVKGDTISNSIAAASILAKVARDRFMLELDSEFPEYGFASHKGYPTKKHFEALDKYGPSKYHRISFLKKYFARQLAIFS